MHFLFKHLLSLAHFLQLIVHAAVIDPEKSRGDGENGSCGNPKRIPPAGASRAQSRSSRQSRILRPNFLQKAFARVRGRSLRRRGKCNESNAAVRLGEFA